MKSSRRGFGYLLLIVGILSAGTVSADEGWAEGTISALDATRSGNYALRVTLKGVAAMCSDGVAWGHLEEMDSNYKVYLVLLLSAQAQKATIAIFSAGNSGFVIFHMFRSKQISRTIFNCGTA